MQTEPVQVKILSKKLYKETDDLKKQKHELTENLLTAK